MMRPKVSVVMPAYNVEQFIAEAVESVLNQSFRDLELVVVDDGSTDSTTSILGGFAAADDRITIVHQENRGISCARNVALKRIRAPLVAMMDADDRSHVDRIRVQLAFLRRNEDVVAVGSQLRLIDVNSRTIGSYKYAADPDEVASQLGTHPGLPDATMMVRREAIDSLGGYRAGLDPAADYDLQIRLSKLGDLTNLTDELYDYRIHARQTTAKRRDLQVLASMLAVALNESGDEPPGRPQAEASIRRLLRDLEVDGAEIDTRLVEGRLGHAEFMFNSGFHSVANSILSSLDRNALAGIQLGRLHVLNGKLLTKDGRHLSAWKEYVHAFLASPRHRAAILYRLRRVRRDSAFGAGD